MTTKGTFSRNYGKRWDNRIPEDPEKDALFDPYINQWSFHSGVEIPTVIRKTPLIFIAEAALDNGLLVGDQFGMILGLRWEL